LPGSSPPAPGTATPARPDWLPGHFNTPQDFRSGYDELAAFKAGVEVKRSTLPSKADDYKAELPADFKVPDGITFAFNQNDPLLSQARSVMHDIDQGRISGQEAFGKLLALYAGGQVASQQQIANGRNAEIAKLGATGPTRIDALTTFFRAYLGEAAGNRRMARVFTAQDVMDAEMEVSKITSQGGARFTGNGREPPAPAGRLTSEQIAKLTPAQRLDYNRQFDQSKMPAWRDPRQ
jgi:hypothetical protein